MKYKNKPWVEIDLDCLKDNYKNIRSIVKKETKICAVVKANAYGHGSVMVAKTLQEEVDYFAVANLDEGLELRRNEIKKPILCLGYIQEASYQEAIENAIEINVYSLEMARALNEIAKDIKKVACIHIKIDTGMSRLGFLPNDKSIYDIIEVSKLENIRLVGIFTHFALADEKDKSFTKHQFEKYKYIVEKLEDNSVRFQIKHVCNSAALIDCPQYHLDMVRPGIILYGHYPSQYVKKEKINLKPVMKLKTTISYFRMLEKGSGVGYGQVYHLPKDMKIATIAIGYADGFSRMLSQKVSVWIGDTKVPIVGNICMDQSMVCIDNLDIKTGQEVLIFGKEGSQDLSELAKALGTINYEILCMVSRRVCRVYLSSNRVLHVDNYLVK